MDDELINVVTIHKAEKVVEDLLQNQPDKEIEKCTAPQAQEKSSGMEIVEGTSSHDVFLPKEGTAIKNLLENRNLIPRYLRASTSSCHDACKYGKERTFEERDTKPSVCSIKSVTSHGQKWHKFRRSSSGENKEKQESKNFSNKRTMICEKLSNIQELAGNSKTATKKPELVAESASSSEHKLKTRPLVRKKPTAHSPTLSIAASLSRPLVVPQNKRGNMNNRLSTSLGVQTILRRKSLSSLGVPGASEPVGSKNLKKSSNVLSINNQKDIYVPLKNKVQRTNSTFPQLSSSSSRVSSDKPLQRGSLRKQHANVPSTTRRFHKFEREEETSVKTIYMVESEPANRNRRQSSSPSVSFTSKSSLCSCPSASSQDDRSSADFMFSEEEFFMSEGENFSNGKQHEAPNNTSRTAEVVNVHKESKDGDTQKYSFKSETVSIETGDREPRRLRLKEGSRVRESPGGKVGLSRRCFLRKKEVVNSKLDTNIDGQPVHLRHQDVHEKKEEQVLLNEVIEVTASKLVETRKSKVKALVGAFETVISLRESKQAALS